MKGFSRPIFSILTAVFLLLPLSLVAANEEILDYAPFFKGSSWVYSSSKGADEKISVVGYTKIGEIETVIAESSLSGRTTFVFTKDSLSRFKAIAQAGDTLLYSNGLVLLKSPLVKGSSWTSDLGKKSEFSVEILGYEDIDIPAGSFKNTVKVGIRFSKSPIYDGILWFAKGVGIVQTLENHLFKTLASYEIGGKNQSVVNPLTGAKLFEKLSPAEVENARSHTGYLAEPEQSSKKIYYLKKVLEPSNIFVIAVLIVFFFFVLLLIKISGFLKGEVDSLSTESKKHLAQTLMDMGNYAKAEKIIRKSMRGSVQFPDVLNSLGVSLKGQEKFRDSIEHFRKALDMNPGYKEAKINLAKSLFEAHEISESEKICKELLEENPSYSDLHNLMAEIYMQTERNDLAKEHLKRALSINPAYERAHNNLKKIEINIKGDSDE